MQLVNYLDFDVILVPLYNILVDQLALSWFSIQWRTSDGLMKKHVSSLFRC